MVFYSFRSRRQPYTAHFLNLDSERKRTLMCPFHGRRLHKDSRKPTRFYAHTDVSIFNGGGGGGGGVVARFN